MNKEEEQTKGDAASVQDLTAKDDTVSGADASTKKAGKKKAAKKTGKKKARRKARKSSNTASAKTAKKRAFPASSFEDALTIPLAIQKIGSGTKVRRLTLFDSLGKSPESGTSRQLITNASRYGLIKGNYTSEFLELTAEGDNATSVDANARTKIAAQFRLAIEGVPPFKILYDQFVRNRLPAPAVLEDAIIETIHEDDRKECVETFIVNAKFVRVLRTVAGAERLLPLDQVLEDVPLVGIDQALPQSDISFSVVSNSGLTSTNGSENWDEVCFYISPIGAEGSEKRNHSDLFLGSIVEPALEEFRLKVIRADQIGKPGMISRQIIEYILKAKLVLVDLSYHNPNVFYELSLRHACRLPTVQIIRKIDDIPFDLDQFRTIQIDTTDIFTLVPNLQSYKAQIATQVRAALKDPDSVDNPLSTYYPNLKVSF
jgi:hypothetical protein